MSDVKVAGNMWAEYWGCTCPDCGPEDYEFMLNEALRDHDRIAALEAENARFGRAIEELEATAATVTGERDALKVQVERLQKAILNGNDNATFAEYARQFITPEGGKEQG